MNATQRNKKGLKVEQQPAFSKSQNTLTSVKDFCGFKGSVGRLKTNISGKGD